MTSIVTSEPSCDNAPCYTSRLRRSEVSLIRAVMFWSNNPNDPVCTPLNKFGMFHYVYEPLNVPFPDDDDDAFTTVATAAFDVVTGLRYMTPFEFEQLVRDPSKNIPHRIPSTTMGGFYNKIINQLVIDKAEVANKVSSTSIHDIVPLPEIPIEQLKYGEKAIKAAHELCYNMMIDNPRMTFDKMKEFGSSHMNDTRARNLYYRLFINLCAKACRSSNTIKLFPYDKVMEGNLSRWLSQNMANLRVLIDDYLTIKICPWCYRPVNITVKKKLASGAAHKASLFTSEYTNEFLYCIEKNNRGIIEFPMVAADPARNRFYLNKIEWNVNKSSKIIIYAHIDYTDKLCISVFDARKKIITVTPVEISPFY
ncbi:hypothetical protein EGW08_021955 [Elysia chlorotica]|uniref:Uncharacterized protein n=1 Tax=Elysia chlorotica TaxID=188477 RepID=A0A433SM69_ELYCH|nr:hypothetical protein EGW08_021955 [Elysia chlorotica]